MVVAKSSGEGGTENNSLLGACRASFGGDESFGTRKRVVVAQYWEGIVIP